MNFSIKCSVIELMCVEYMYAKVGTAGEVTFLPCMMTGGNRQCSIIFILKFHNKSNSTRPHAKFGCEYGTSCFQ
jgi:hypothetical protein